jgi:hypothetical protein
MALSKIHSLCEVSGDEATKDNGGAWVESRGSPSTRAPPTEIGLGLGKTQMRVQGDNQQDPPSPERQQQQRSRTAIVKDWDHSSDEGKREVVESLGVPMRRGICMRTTGGVRRTREVTVENSISREVVLTTLDEILLSIISPHGRQDRAQPLAVHLRDTGDVSPCAQCKKHRLLCQRRIVDHLLCDDCERLFHLTCLNPAEGYSATDDTWQCPMCVASQAAAFETAMDQAYGTKQPRQTSELLNLSNALQSSLPHPCGSRATFTSGNESGGVAGRPGDALEAEGSGLHRKGREMCSQSWHKDNGLLWRQQLELSSYVGRGSRVGPAYQTRVREGPLSTDERAQDSK